MTSKPPVLGQHYEIVSVTRTDPPRGAVGGNWYRYVIGQGEQVIAGHQQGSLNAVTKTAQEFVEQLNLRRLGKSGRVNLVPTPKKYSHT